MEQQNILKMATELLKSTYGANAEFREGQYEAIEATILNKKTLVVQKTGWGKSLVYFMSTKIQRLNNRGVTFVISPLLTLMENQLEAANKLGIKCEMLNSTTKVEHNRIVSDIVNNKVDLVLVTPETLFTKLIQESLKDINIGLFVIDEAHCISDWGHDFRLKYCNLHKIIAMMPKSVPILATTATANNRVIEDLKKQLGENVHVSTGSLMRSSLYIQLLQLNSIEERYAWIMENINKLNGSGIIYCLTQRACDYLTIFLNENNISAKSYYSRDPKSEYLNTEAQEQFLKNEIKVLVATVKLGMGYDKADIGFVIHFQQPSNIVAYYQQIGRAGRSIPNADTFLMTGSEDETIQNYFIESAFPSKKEYTQILDYIFENTENGVKEAEIIANVNIRKVRIDKVLMFLENDGYILKEGAKYYVTTKQFVYDEEKYKNITKLRKEEQEQMKEYTNITTCYNKYIVNKLDDNTNENCGNCSNCLGYNKIETNPNMENIEKAQEYLNRLIIPILPRKRWIETSISERTKIEYQNEEGICVAKYGESGYGELVKRDKYSGNERFCEELEGKAVEVLKEFSKGKNIIAITYIPSLRSGIVKDFAERMAKRCNVPCLELIQKSQAKPQKEMENASYQCLNALESFSIIEGKEIPKNILLIDDVVDSKWTLTVCGSLLKENGAECVYPFALADSSTSN